MPLKVLCFHPALAPYRVDFFNLLAEQVDLRVVFLERNVPSQKHNQQCLLAKVRFKYEYLTNGINLRGRCIRFGFIRRIRAICPDVVIGYEASPLTFVLGIARLFGLITSRLYTSVDENARQIVNRRGIRRLVRDVVLRLVDGVIVASEDAQRAIRHIRGEDSPCSVIPIIHDISEIRECENEVAVQARTWRKANVGERYDRVVLFVGRLVDVKNLLWLIDAFKEYRRLDDKTLLAFVGDGPDLEKLKNKVNEKELSSCVKFEGRKEGVELYAVMAAADALVLCSKSETYGAVVAEAMQWGTPCLVSDTCGAASIVEPRINGAVFKYNNVKAFVKDLDAVLRIKRGIDSILKINLRSYINKFVEEIEYGK